MPDLDWSRYAVPVGDGVVEQSYQRASGDSGAEMEFIASTAGEASDGDIVDQATWKLARYRSNPVVLYEHAVPVVGTARVNTGGANQDPLRAWITFDESVENPTGRLVAHQHRAGIRSAVSVRWTPGEIVARNKLPKDHPAYAEPREVDTWWGGKMEVVGRFHRRPTLLEISSVALPADPRALQVRGAHGLTGEQIRSALADPSGRVRTMRDALLDLLRDGDPEVRGVLRTLIATLSPTSPRPVREAASDPRVTAALAGLRSTLSAWSTP